MMIENSGKTLKGEEGTRIFEKRFFVKKTKPNVFIKPSRDIQLESAQTVVMG